jgi:hypothetical protein
LYNKQKEDDRPAIVLFLFEFVQTGLAAARVEPVVNISWAILMKAAIAGEIHLSLCQTRCITTDKEGPAQLSTAIRFDPG